MEENETNEPQKIFVYLSSVLAVQRDIEWLVTQARNEAGFSQVHRDGQINRARGLSSAAQLLNLPIQLQPSTEKALRDGLPRTKEVA